MLQLIWRSIGYLLPRRLQVAREEQKAQDESHATASATVEPAVLAQWTMKIKEWHAQENLPLKSKTVENPYLSVWRKGTLVIVSKIY